MAAEPTPEMVSVRRVGSETSTTRDLLLDNVERLMLDEGYAAVSYRRVAALSDVTPSLVQYYFPKLDGLFIAVLRRHSDQNFDRLSQELRTYPDQPLRVLWNYSRDETTAALMVEFMALANHRNVFQAELAKVVERSRKLQLKALSSRWHEYDLPTDTLTAAAAQSLLDGIPKMLLLQCSLKVPAGHADLLQLIEGWLDRLEPLQNSRKARIGGSDAGSQRVAQKNRLQKQTRKVRASQPSRSA